MAELIPLFQRAGVTAVFSGHEHNFQHAQVDGIDYFVSGAAGKFRTNEPDRFREAHTRSWSAQCHFLLVRVVGDRMLVRAIGEPSEAAGLNDIVRLDPDGQPMIGPLEVRV